MIQESKGVLYFIQAPINGYIKIGYTAQQPRMRLLSIQAMSPVELVLLGCCPGDQDDEARLHERFAGIRAHGEWFKACEELLAYIRSNTGGHESPRPLRAANETIRRPKTEAPSSLGLRLRRLIEQKRGRRSLSAIARASDMSPQQLDGILSGHRKSPQLTTIYRILAAIDATPEELEQLERKATNQTDDPMTIAG
jgi:hypothetical protein